MIEINGEIVVEKPVEAVFAFISDPTHTPRSQPDIVSTEVETPGPVRRGTRFRETMKMGPWRLDSSCEVVEHEAPSRVTFEATGRVLRYACRFTFEPIPEGTRLRIAGTAGLAGWRRILEPMLGAGMRKAVPQQLARMRACLLETPAPARARVGAAAVALVAALLATAPVASAAEGAPAPELKRTVAAFAGKWIMDTTITAPGGPPQKTQLTTTCRETAGGKAVSCDMVGKVPGAGPMEAAFIVGFDTFGKRVHFMAITSDEEVHDHVCRWTDATTLACDPLKGGLMGDAITEDLVVTSGPQRLSFKSTMTLKDGGRVLFEAAGRRKK
jgi:carbon monoxide dehydrogenase subunit G